MFNSDDFANAENVFSERGDARLLDEPTDSTVVRSSDEVSVAWAAMGISILALTINLSAVSSEASEGPLTSPEEYIGGSQLHQADRSGSQSKANWNAKRLQLIDKKYDTGLEPEEADQLDQLNSRMDDYLAENFQEPNKKLDRLEELVDKSLDSQNS